jgi:hypothetical protein
VLSRDFNHRIKLQGFPKKRRGPFDFIGISRGRSDNNRNQRKYGVISDKTKKLVAVHDGHHDVQKNKSRPLSAIENLERVSPIYRRQHIEAFGFKNLAQRQSNVMVIFDNHYGIAVDQNTFPQAPHYTQKLKIIKAI